jgi:hypothetical protein
MTAWAFQVSRLTGTVSAHFDERTEQGGQQRQKQALGRVPRLRPARLPALRRLVAALGRRHCHWRVDLVRGVRVRLSDEGATQKSLEPPAAGARPLLQLQQLGQVGICAVAAVSSQNNRMPAPEQDQTDIRSTFNSVPPLNYR